MSSLTFNILSQKCSDERKSGTESLQYLYIIMSKNGGNRCRGCRGNRCFVMKGFWIIHRVNVSPIGTPSHSLETGCIFTEFYMVINVSI